LIASESARAFFEIRFDSVGRVVVARKLASPFVKLVYQELGDRKALPIGFHQPFVCSARTNDISSIEKAGSRSSVKAGRIGDKAVGVTDADAEHLVERLLDCAEKGLYGRVELGMSFV
jgi:hypothetical protein